MALSEISPKMADTLATDTHHKACDELGSALDEGKIGEIVAKHEKLILQYYRDVQAQAKKSFDTARIVAQIGFYVGRNARGKRLACSRVTGTSRSTLSSWPILRTHSVMRRPCPRLIW